MGSLRSLLCAAAVATTPGLAGAAEAVAVLIDTEGRQVGTVHFMDTASGTIRIAIEAEGLPAGELAIHVHETGDCSVPDFASAGGHLSLGHQHGVMAEGGPHPGDLPNLHVGDDGAVAVEYFTDRISLAADAGTTVFDADGSAVVIHTGADDYSSQPSGNAGDRFACGVIEAPEAAE
jgi:Cu-Zn family superoxide dismutase